MNENNNLDKLENRAKLKKKDLFEYMKIIKINEDKNFIDKITEALKAEGDFNFKKGLDFIRFPIDMYLDSINNICVLDGIPFVTYEERSTKTPLICFKAHKESMTEVEAKKLQELFGYPEFPFGFFGFKKINEFGNNVYSWHCYKNTD